MNKQYEMGKTMFEVMKMRKNNKETPFQLRKYYGIMIVVFTLFLGIMAYYSATFRQKRDQAKQEIKLEERSIGANNSATNKTTQTTKTTTAQAKEKTKTANAQAKRTMNKSVTYNGTSKLTWPVKGNIILPYSVNSTIYFESLDQYRINKGILIEAKEGTEVKAVKQSKVREIRKSAEYGQTVLMDLGNEYTVLYGQLKDIRVKEVRLIDENGENRGVVSIREALQIAADAGLDLIEISPQAVPPVCKVLDYGKYKYEAQKRKAEAKKNQKVIEIKELKLRPMIDKHDYEVKVKQAKRFLDEGNKVKFTMRYKGRELSANDMGKAVLDRLLEDLEGLCKVDSAPKLEGKQMMMIVSPEK